MKLKWVNQDGDFVLEQAQKAPDVYMPLVNESHMISSITPWLTGDCKRDQNTFLLRPATEEDLAAGTTGRNFWVKRKGFAPWSVTGCSATQLGKQNTPEEESCLLEGGMLWQKTHRTWKESELKASVLSFVPVEEVQVEVMQVTLENQGTQPIELECIAAIPVYGRSADHLRDHRHVTSLLHRGYITKYGLDVAPTLTFDERGHLPDDVTYRVWGMDGQGEAPRYCVPMARDFYGDGSPLNPACVVNTPAPTLRAKEGSAVQGGEMVGALYFAPCTLAAGEKIQYQVVLSIDTDPTPYLSAEAVEQAWQRTREYWKKQSTCQIETGDEVLTAWFRWVSIQPVLRRICGCSFLPHHDYGRGGRGWRDLWQDSLALLLSQPDEVRADLLSHFGGVRPDGTNATIIGTKAGEFKADRNNIPRVWMDHGFWPFFTIQLYLEETGDFGFLQEKRPYFEDGFAYRGDGQRPTTSTGRQGSVLEHLLVQQVTAFFDVGEHGHIRLRGADWNDGLDMAQDKGESVAFTAAYAGSLCWLAELVGKMPETEFSLHAPLVKLMQTAYGQPEAMNEALYHYCQQAYETVQEVDVSAQWLKDTLQNMGQWIFEHIRQQEWMNDEGELNWFNSYYDNSGRQVEGVHGTQVRMMLTGQVFTMLSGVATEEQVDQIIRSVFWYLWEAGRGGCFLNTDFNEVKMDLGRMFGFDYGTKENGAVFSHMAVMYAYALYHRGRAAEGLKVLDALYRQSVDFDKGHILPGIPEYFDLSGRGMYPYLTGAASWYLLTVRKQMFGIQGEQGQLCLRPKLLPHQFDQNGEAKISCVFSGVPITVIYQNPNRVSYGSYTYTIKEIRSGQQTYQMPLTVAQLKELKEPIYVQLDA